MAYIVSKSKFAQLVNDALDELPEPFAGWLEEVPVEIKDRPDPAMLLSLGMASHGLLLGLYQGRPRTSRSVEDSGHFPDRIFIFQETIQQFCQNEPQLIQQVRTTVLHEIGHHFGLDEKDLARLGYG